jgi:hypothetical protein
VALRTIEAGETILKENPLIFGPQGPMPLCLGCCQTVTKNSPRCEKCGVPVCSKACADSEMHKTFECEALMKSGWLKTPKIESFWKSPNSFNDMILVLRIFLLREKDPDRWAFFWNLESNMTKKQVIFTNTVDVVKLLQITIGLLQEDIPTLNMIMGIICINLFADEVIGQLFGLASIPKHDCVANSIYNVSSAEEGWVMTFKALRTIKEGEQITMSYMNPFKTVLKRQNLLAGKSFVVSIFCISSRQQASSPFLFTLMFALQT